MRIERYPIKNVDFEDLVLQQHLDMENLQNQNVSIEKYLKGNQKDWKELIPLVGEGIFKRNLRMGRMTILGQNPNKIEKISFHLYHAICFYKGVPYVIDKAFGIIPKAYNLLEKLF